MKTRQPRRPRTALCIAIATGALAALAAAVPARALDQSAWLQQQLAASDGGSYSPVAAGEKSVGGYQRDAQAAWLEGQLAISDGSAPPDGRVFAPIDGSGTLSQQFAFVEHGLHQSDGCND